MRTYHLFVSHSWRYGDTYDRLIELLRDAPYFNFRDYSVPEDDPVHDADNDAELREAIREQMSHASVVLVMAGVYATYSKWINIEIDLAESGFNTRKPIIAVRPWGSERISRRVREAADKIVGWNTNSIVSAIKELG